jgi:hypothetical protein
MLQGVADLMKEGKITFGTASLEVIKANILKILREMINE